MEVPTTPKRDVEDSIEPVEEEPSCPIDQTEREIIQEIDAYLSHASPTDNLSNNGLSTSIEKFQPSSAREKTKSPKKIKQEFFSDFQLGRMKLVKNHQDVDIKITRPYTAKRKKLNSPDKRLKAIYHSPHRAPISPMNRKALGLNDCRFARGFYKETNKKAKSKRKVRIKTQHGSEQSMRVDSKNRKKGSKPSQSNLPHSAKHGIYSSHYSLANTLVSVLDSKGRDPSASASMSPFPNGREANQSNSKTRKEIKASQAKTTLMRKIRRTASKTALNQNEKGTKQFKSLIERLNGRSDVNLKTKYSRLKFVEEIEEEYDHKEIIKIPSMKNTSPKTYRFLDEEREGNIYLKLKSKIKGGFSSKMRKTGGFTTPSVRKFMANEGSNSNDKRRMTSKFNTPYGSKYLSKVTANVRMAATRKKFATMRDISHKDEFKIKRIVEASRKVSKNYFIFQKFSIFWSFQKMSFC